MPKGKILIASDIHGRVSAFSKLFFRIREENPQVIFLLGDLAYNGPRNGVPDDYDPMAVINGLSNLGIRIVAVRGNCDSRVDSSLLGWTLEDYLQVEVFGKTFLLHHGDLPLPKDVDYSIVIYGHTHLYEAEERDGLLFLNPGSVGYPKGGRPATYAILEEDSFTVKRLEDGGDELFLHLN